MAEKTELKVDVRTENGDTETSKSTWNGKRTMESSPGLELDCNDIPISKKAKTVHNGTIHTATENLNPSPELISNQTQSKPHLQNGYSDDQNSSKTPNIENRTLVKPNTAVAASNGEMRNGLANKDLNSQAAMDTGRVASQVDTAAINGPKSSQDRSKLTLDPSKITKESTDPTSASDQEPEIITLSDSEDEFQEVLSKALSVNSSDATRYKLLKLYQDQLRAEETKLILLSKLKQSLSRAVPPSAAMEVSAKMVGAADMRGSHSASASHTNHRLSSNAAPPPLRKGTHQHQQQLGLSNSQHHKVAPGHYHQSPSHHAGSNSSMSDRMKSSHHMSSGSHSGAGSGGPPPLVNMAKNSPNHTNGGAAAFGNYQSVSAREPKKAVPPPPPKLSAEQKLSGARTLLKKQLEQALRQIPAPKPPPPEVNFLPSLASGEFVYMIGMEEVVKQLLSTEQKDVKFVFNPFSCVQCKTDFTPVWKRDKPGSKNVICEKCITSNQKRVLKQEHTAKLKAVFTKALQKEQEIERRVSAGSPLSDMPGLSALVQPTRSSLQSNAAASAAASSVQASPTPSMPQLTPQHNNSSPSPSNQLTSAQLQQHQQALLQAQAAEQMRAMLAAQMAMPYQMFGVQNKQAVELQRQYLLDMINPNRSWKT